MFCGEMGLLFNNFFFCMIAYDHPSSFNDAKTSADFLVGVRGYQLPGNRADVACGLRPEQRRIYV